MKKRELSKKNKNNFPSSLLNKGKKDEFIDEKKILRELKKNLTRLLGESLDTMILYGSKARGDYDSESDIDVAIIVHGLTRQLKDEILTKVAEIEIKYLLPLSTVILSRSEFERLKKRERRLALDIEREGIPI